MCFTGINFCILQKVSLFELTHCMYAYIVTNFFVSLNDTKMTFTIEHCSITPKSHICLIFHTLTYIVAKNAIILPPNKSGNYGRKPGDYANEEVNVKYDVREDNVKKYSNYV